MTRVALAALGDVAKISRNGVPPEKITDGTLYVGLENIERGGRLVGIRRVRAGELASGKFSFTDQDVLFGKLRPNLAKIARPYFGGVCSTDILPVTPGPKLHRDYLAHFLAQPAIVALAASRANGANLPRLSPAELAAFEIPLPPITEQRRIAEVLDRTDALRAKRHQTLALHDDLAQSIFIDMFGDPVVNPHSWQLAALGSLMETRGAKVDPTGFLDEPFDLLSIPAYDAGHPTIAYGREIGSTKQLVQPNDVLLAKIVPHIRRAWIVPQPRGRRLIASGEWMVFRDSRAEPSFLKALLASDSFHRNFMSTVAGVGGSLLRARPAFVARLLVPLPPLALQRQFGQRLTTLAEAHAVVGQQSAGLDRLFASLQQRAFAGQL